MTQWLIRDCTARCLRTDVKNMATGVTQVLVKWWYRNRSKHSYIHVRTNCYAGTAEPASHSGNGQLGHFLQGLHMQRWSKNSFSMLSNDTELALEAWGQEHQEVNLLDWFNGILIQPPDSTREINIQTDILSSKRTCSTFL